jgi:hypothetical protein
MARLPNEFARRLVKIKVNGLLQRPRQCRFGQPTTEIDEGRVEPLASPLELSRIDSRGNIPLDPF